MDGKIRLLSLESCCGRPKMRNSVLEGLRDGKLEDIQLANSIFNVIDVLRDENDKRS